MTIFRRWWQTHGFGVQSKTDYDYLRDVLTEPLPYYAYDSLPDKTSRLIYRICNRARDGKVTMVGAFTPLEVKAATMALGHSPDRPATLRHLHGLQTLIVKGIDSQQAELWKQVLGATAVTWDMKHIGLAQFLSRRYPEHYSIMIRR